jgi:hypothetical protein
MNSLDKEIMTSILTEKQSMYGLEKNLKKSNYATVWRHIKKMQKEGLLTIAKASRKNGKLDKRGTEKQILTPKGLATLVIEGDLQKGELMKIGMKIFEKEFSKLETSAEPFMTDVFSNALLKIKPKVNLKYFDENWFREIYWISILESGKEAIKKYKEKYQNKGIWATDAELEKETVDTFDRLMNGEHLGLFE